MNNWNTHLAKLISLHSRAKNMEEALNFKKLIYTELTPGKLVEKLQVAHDVKAMYAQAHRMCSVLADNIDDEHAVNLNHIQLMIESGLRRINDIIKILDYKGKKWGLTPEPGSNNTKPRVNHNIAPSPSFDTEHDISAADDSYVDADVLKADVKASLKSLMRVVDYMEVPTLLSIQKRLDKLVDY